MRLINIHTGVVIEGKGNQVKGADCYFLEHYGSIYSYSKSDYRPFNRPKMHKNTPKGLVKYLREVEVRREKYPQSIVNLTNRLLNRLYKGEDIHDYLSSHWSEYDKINQCVADLLEYWN